ncbi:AAA family ATPase (plasmid) [Amycolatopsis sp. FU40]|uniref:ParA family protein n=1 Tax=Amycolatopsis sp. FU40 TaxID=2914159 RepID=UPI001F3A7B6B|nr:ParA family protein [Amycolatopsis sp. FU40]UKD50749.1 AAA family ATPase [Amycolatopsis sp. FU40]
MTEPIKEIDRPLVIAVANQKGGTGKTTSTINLAVALRSFGLRTLMVDIDQQANATSGLGVDGTEAERTIYEVLHRDPKVRCTIMEAAVETKWGVLVVPGTDALIEIEESGDDPGREWRLRKALAKLPQPHVVLIDCPPNLGRCTTIALCAADVVIAPVKPGIDELEALAKLEGTISRLVENEVNESLVLGGVMAVEYSGGSQLHKDVRKKLEKRYGSRYLGEISKTVRVGEAKAAKRPLLFEFPDSTAAEDYRAIGKKLAERIAS